MKVKLYAFIVMQDCNYLNWHAWHTPSVTRFSD